MTEAVLTRRIKDALNDLPKTWAVKIHGGRYQAGIPDIIGCHQGDFFGLEVKLPGKERNLTKLQALILSRIKRAGGIAAMVTSVDQAMEALRGNTD